MRLYFRHVITIMTSNRIECFVSLCFCYIFHYSPYDCFILNDNFCFINVVFIVCVSLCLVLCSIPIIQYKDIKQYMIWTLTIFERCAKSMIIAFTHLIKHLEMLKFTQFASMDQSANISMALIARSWQSSDWPRQAARNSSRLTTPSWSASISMKAFLATSSLARMFGSCNVRVISRNLICQVSIVIGHCHKSEVSHYTKCRVKYCQNQFFCVTLFCVVNCEVLD